MNVGKSGTERFSRFCAGVVLALISVAVVYLFAASLFATSDVSTGEGFGEIIRFERDSLAINLAVLALCTALLACFWRLCDHVRLSVLTAILLTWTVLAGAVFIASVKLATSQDSYVVTFWAMQSARGDTSYYHFYFERFPYQFGYAAYEELVFRAIFFVLPNIPEGFACMLLQGLNVLFLAAAEYGLLRCAGLLFRSERVQKLTAVLLLFSLHGILFSTYLYGNLPGFAFAVLAVWAFLAFQETGRVRAGVLCALCMALAVIMKLNYMIFFIAIVIVWLLCLLRRPQLKSLLCLLLCVVSVLALKDMPQHLYERRMGEDFGKGITLWGWMALGFHEGSTCSGWYDPTYTVNAFEKAGGDRAASARTAREAIARRLEEFRGDPGEALAFFDRKFLSQWNEPTYEVIWNNNVREHFSEPGRLYTLLCRDGEGTLKAVMNAYQQLILFGLTAALAALWRRREICECLLPLILLGGMLYHILFEAKSQYACTFFLLMIPMAAYGLSVIYEKLFRKKA